MYVHTPQHPQMGLFLGFFTIFALGEILAPVPFSRFVSMGAGGVHWSMVFLLFLK